MNKFNILNDWFLCPCLNFYLFVCVHLLAKFLPHLMIQHSHSSGKLPLHLRTLHTPIYPLGPPEPEIAATNFPIGLQSTLNESISVAPASVWAGLVLVSAIHGLQATLNERISSSPSHVSVYCYNKGWRSLPPQGGMDLFQGRAWQSHP